MKTTMYGEWNLFSFSVKKSIVALLSLVVLMTNLSAQRIIYNKGDSIMDDSAKKNLCDAYMKEFKDKYVFEGKIISSKYGISIKTGEQTHYNFNSYLVEVQKVIKGNIQKGTIEIIETAPGSVYKVGEHIVPAPIMPDGNPIPPPPNEAIYFCKTKTDIKDSSVANTNSISLQNWDAIPLSNGELVNGPREITQCFSTLAELYDYISTNYGVKIDSGK